MAQHKWHKEIKAWADGAEIQWKVSNDDTDMWTDDEYPDWRPRYDYRIKPQPIEPDFDATKYPKALKESGKKFKEKIEQAFAEILDKEISKLAQPKDEKPKYLYVYKDCGEVCILEDKFADFAKNITYIGKIKLETEDHGD